MELVRLAVERRLSVTVLREAQDCVALFLKGAPRLVAPEPTQTTTSPNCSATRPRVFPSRLATISTEMARDRGIPFYGDEHQTSAPRTSSTSRMPNGWRPTSRTSPISATAY